MKDPTCRLCGAQLAPNYRFCPMCGKRCNVSKLAASGITLLDAYLAWLPTRESNLSRNSMASYRRAAFGILVRKRFGDAVYLLANRLLNLLFHF